LGVTDGGRICIDKVELFAGSCPGDGDTRCTALTVEPAGPAPLYTATATAVDDSGDAIFYTFVADNGVDAPLVIGPRGEDPATSPLAEGPWTVTVPVTDDPGCPNPPAAPSCTQKVTVGGGQPKFRRGDADGSGKVDITDAVLI